MAERVWGQVGKFWGPGLLFLEKLQCWAFERTEAQVGVFLMATAILQVRDKNLN